MVNFVKEIAQRVSLYDIIQQAKETDKLVEKIEDEEKKQKQVFTILPGMPAERCSEWQEIWK